MSGDRSEQGQAPNSGKKMVGGFEVLGELGRGAMGAVFKARQVSMNRTVALKVLPPSLAANDSFVRRFVREAQAAAQLNHPNIVQGIDAGRAGVYYYFAMEYVDGQGVDALLRAEGQLPERRALSITRDIARALEHAHANDIIHRDVKLANILIAKDGTAKLADLGLAREIDAGAVSVTQTGTVLGTPNYMSPEQARGDKDIDGRSDIYSLGATLYHMVAGQPPYQGGSLYDVVAKHMSAPVPDAHEVNPSVSTSAAAIIRKAMAKNPAQRYPDAGAMLKDVEQVLAGEPPAEEPQPAPPQPSVAPFGEPPVRNRGRKVVAAALAAAALIAIAAGAVALFADKETADPPPGAPLSGQGAEPYAYAQKWIKQHPGEVQEGIDKLETVRAQVKDAVLRMKIDDDVRDLRRKRDAAADAAFAKLEASAQALARSGDVDGSIGVYGNLRGPFKDLLAARATTAASQLQRNAEKALRAAMSVARRLNDEGEPLKGIEELDKAKHIKYAALTGEMSRIRARLQAASLKAEEMEQRRALAAARTALRNRLDGIEAAVAAGNATKGAQAARAAKDDEALAPLPAQRDGLAAVGGALAGFASFKQVALADALRRLVGKAVSIDTTAGRREGTLERVSDTNVVVAGVKVVSGMEVPRKYDVKMADITPECRQEFAPSWQPKSLDDYMAQAIIAAARKDAGGLAAALTSAEAHPLHALYAKRLARLRASLPPPDDAGSSAGGAGTGTKARSPAELAAERSWKAILRIYRAGGLTRARAGAIDRALDRFERLHGATEHAEAVADSIDKLRRKIGPHLGQPRDRPPRPRDRRRPPEL